MRQAYDIISECGSLSGAILSFEQVMSMQKRITVLKRGIGKNDSEKLPISFCVPPAKKITAGHPKFNRL